MPQRILLTQLRRIGDVIMTLPAVAALREALPDAHLTYLTEPPSDLLFRHSTDVNEVLVAPPQAGALRQLALMRDLRRRRFDAVVDFFGNPRSALLTLATGAPRRIGFDFRGRRRAYTETASVHGHGPYSAQHKAALVAPLGAHVRDPRPRLALGEAERAYARRVLEGLGVGPGDFLVILWPVSRRSYKVWPAERYAHLADALVERYDARVLLVHGAGEAHFADAVRLHMVNAALPDYPKGDLLELAALIERAHLFVGNDGGPRQLAVAVNTPSLTVFGKDFAEAWTPPGQHVHRAVERDPGCKRACHYPRCGEECIKDVPYAAVEDALEAYLEELLRDGRPVRREPPGAPA